MFAGGPAFDGFDVTNFFYFWSCFSCFETKLKMDYLTDPVVIMPILVVAFHFLTAAGFWIYFCRQMSSFENGKLFLLIDSWLWGS